jgi:hypothetical protein
MVDKNEPRKETYCMLPLNHSGKHSIYQFSNICHVCDPPSEFSTIVELEKHVKQVHRMWKG